MRFVVAGGGVAGLAAGLAIARAGHEAVVLERDHLRAGGGPLEACEAERRGIPHFQQPHAFLPRGRRELADWAPDVLAALADAGAEEQDLADGLRGPREPGDEDLVYLWVRRPVIEWALRRAAEAQDGLELRAGVDVSGLVATEDARPRATGVALSGGDVEHGDVVVDALGRYRPPAGWPRAASTQGDCGAVYFCRYFRLRDGVEHLPPPPSNPLSHRGDLGYMGFNTFRGDNRTYAVIVLAPGQDRDLKILRDERAWMAACAAMRPIDTMTAPEYGEPITPVMPMGGLTNVERTGDPGVDGLVAIGDAFCHTDPALAWGLSFALAHARALGHVARHTVDPLRLAQDYRDEATPEAGERYALACSIDDARTRHWAGETQDVGRRDGCYPLFSLMAATVAATQDDLVLRRTFRRIGMLDRTAVFDDDSELHTRIESIFAKLMVSPPPPPGPPRDELIARIGAATG